MGADASIFQQYLNPIKSMADYSADYDRADSAKLALVGQRRQNEMAGLQADVTREGMADAAAKRNAIRDIYTALGKDAQPLSRARALQANPLTAGEGVAAEKSILDNDKSRAATAKDLSEVLDKKLSRSREILGSMVDNPQSAAMWIRAQYEDPDIGPVMKMRGTLDEALARIPTDQAGFANWRAQGAIGIEKYAASLKQQTSNTGGSTVTQVFNPYTQALSEVGRVVNTQSPDSVATNATAESNNRRTVGASYANAAATRDVAQSNRDAASIQVGFKNETDLRKEFEGLGEVKNYKQAFPAYAAVKDAATRNTPQSDINIVYGIAKLYDPTSVVREGEYATVANSPAIPERIKGYAQYLSGGGRLTEAVKRDLLAEATGRIGTYRAEVDKARSSYEGIAKQRGMKPEAVFQAMGDAPAGGAVGPTSPAAKSAAAGWSITPVK